MSSFFCLSLYFEPLHNFKLKAVFSITIFTVYTYSMSKFDCVGLQCFCFEFFNKQTATLQSKIARRNK